MNRDKFDQVKKVLFDTSQPTTEPATQPVATTEPADRLAELLAKASGRPAGEQLISIRQAFETERGELDRKQRELDDERRQIVFAQTQIKLDRAKVDQGQKDLQAQKDEQAKLLADKGFQDSLQLYTVMPTKTVKSIFMNLSDDTVMHYLVAMDPPTAGKIIKEFKTPDEWLRIQKVVEKIRLSQSSTAPSGAPADVPAAARGLPSPSGGPTQAALPQ